MQTRNGTLQLLWLIVEIFCVVRSAVASFNVTMGLSNDDLVFSAFTVGTIELSLFAMLLMSGVEVVAPIASLILIAFSGVLQWAELSLLTGAMDDQTKTMIRYAVSFAPTALLLMGLVKRLTSRGESFSFGGFVNGVRGLFGRVPSGQPAKALNTDAENNGWVETRKVKRWRDGNGRKRSRSLPSGQRSKNKGGV